MTIPIERTRAVLAAERFLVDLIVLRKPKVPREVRERARRVLRHFPSAYHMARSADKLPDVWGEPE